jgi:hypothetical protein
MYSLRFALCGFQRAGAFTTEYLPLFRKGDDGGGDTPLPIPNREVKPASADGTARSPRGRVGRRPFLLVVRWVSHRALGRRGSGR